MEEIEDGYPDSPRDELIPPSEPESLDEADHEVVTEHRHELTGRRPDGSVDDEDRLTDSHDADELSNAAARPHVMGGAGPVDTSNFNDNTADWSRERT